MSPAAPGDRSTASFLRGLTLGGLIGAIIAGSSLWSRRRRRREKQAAAARLAKPYARTGTDELEPAGRVMAAHPRST